MKGTQSRKIRATRRQGRATLAANRPVKIQRLRFARSKGKPDVRQKAIRVTAHPAIATRPSRRRVLLTSGCPSAVSWEAARVDIYPSRQPATRVLLRHAERRRLRPQPLAAADTRRPRRTENEHATVVAPAQTTAARCSLDRSGCHCEEQVGTSATFSTACHRIRRSRGPIIHPCTVVLGHSVLFDAMTASKRSQVAKPAVAPGRAVTACQDGLPWRGTWRRRHPKLRRHRQSQRNLRQVRACSVNRSSSGFGSARPGRSTLPAPSHGISNPGEHGQGGRPAGCRLWTRLHRGCGRVGARALAALKAAASKQARIV